MPLTKSFKETVLADIRRSPQFAQAMLREAVCALLDGESGVGRNLLRDYINGTIGFGALSDEVGVPAKSLMRMFGPKGNPQMNNLFAVIGALQRHAGIELHLAEVSLRTPARRSKAKPKPGAQRRNSAPPRYPEAPASSYAGVRETDRKFRRS